MFVPITKTAQQQQKLECCTVYMSLELIWNYFSNCYLHKQKYS